MTWLRLEDTFPEHPKIVGLSDRSFRLLVTILAYAARNSSDGLVPRRFILGWLSVHSPRGHRHEPTRELHRAGLVEIRDNGDLLIHDFLDYNPSKQDVQARRQATAERVQKWREARRNGVTPSVTATTGNAVSNAPPGPSHPDPSLSTTLRDSRRAANGQPRKPDPVWDGLTEWLSREPETRSERGAWNKAAKEMREIGVTDSASVVARGKAYERKYPGVVPTPNGLVKHWSELNGASRSEIPDPDWIETYMNGKGGE
jgi:hypothetical protein